MIWSGWGGLVLPIVAFTVLGCTAVAGALGVEAPIAAAFVWMAAGWVSGVIILVLCWLVEEKGRPRLLPDGAPYRVLVRAPTPGQFLRLPTRAWSLLVPALAMMTGALKLALSA